MDRQLDTTIRVY